MPDNVQEIKSRIMRERGEIITHGEGEEGGRRQYVMQEENYNFDLLLEDTLVAKKHEDLQK